MTRNVWTFAFLVAAQALEGQQAERIAAVLFAKANGFDVPAATIVARETLSDSTRPGVLSKTSGDARSRAADAIVASLRLTAGAGSVRDLLECRRQLCVGRTQAAVLVVGDPADSRGRTVVQLELYAPGIDSRGEAAQSVTFALVEVERTGERWTGVAYRIRPITSYPRLPAEGGWQRSAPWAPTPFHLGGVQPLVMASLSRYPGSAAAPLRAVMAVLALGGSTPAKPADSSVAPARQSVRDAVLVEDMRILSDESVPERALTHVTALAVLDNGMVVTGHGGEGLLRVFDATGRFLRTLSRKGDGPGEIRVLNALGPRGDSIWVVDRGAARISVFPASGGNPRLIQLPLDFWRDNRTVVSLLPGDLLLLRRDFLTRGQGTMAFIMTDPPFSGVVTLNSVRDSTEFLLADASLARVTRLYMWKRNPAQFLRARMDGEEKAFPELFLPAVEAAGSAVTGRVLLDAGLWNGAPGQVRVISIDAQGRIDSSTVNFPPRPLNRPVADSLVRRVTGGFALSYYRDEGRVNTQQAAEFDAEVRRRITVPSHIPIVSTSLAGSDGSIWINDRFDRRIWMVAGPRGNLLRVRMPEKVRLAFASERHVWGVGANADDVPILIRYVIR